MNRDFDGRRCVVTGAASGLGRQVAEHLAARGAEMVLIDRDTARLQPVAARVGGRARILDVTDSAAVAACLGALGRIDVLVNSAGTEGPRGALDRVDPDALDAVMALNARAALACAQAAARAMTSAGQGGAIVNIASTAGFVGSPHLGLYAMSKAAVISMTKSLAIALAPRRIRVNAVCPGSIDSEMFARSVAGDNPEAETARLIGLHPLGRLGTPAEVAAAIAFLASDAASYITGVALPVDGGRLA